VFRVTVAACVERYRRFRGEGFDRLDEYPHGLQQNRRRRNMIMKRLWIGAQALRSASVTPFEGKAFLGAPPRVRFVTDMRAHHAHCLWMG
jgi:hypothetical protein